MVVRSYANAVSVHKLLLRAAAWLFCWRRFGPVCNSDRLVVHGAKKKQCCLGLVDIMELSENPGDLHFSSSGVTCLRVNAVVSDRHVIINIGCVSKRFVSKDVFNYLKTIVDISSNKFFLCTVQNRRPKDHPQTKNSPNITCCSQFINTIMLVQIVVNIIF